MKAVYDKQICDDLTALNVDRQTYNGTLLETLREIVTPKEATRLLDDLITETEGGAVQHINMDAAEEWEAFYDLVETKGSAMEDLPEWELRSVLGHIANGMDYFALAAVLLRLAGRVEAKASMNIFEAAPEGYCEVCNPIGDAATQAACKGIACNKCMDAEEAAKAGVLSA